MLQTYSSILSVSFKERSRLLYCRHALQVSEACNQKHGRDGGALLGLISRQIYLCMTLNKVPPREEVEESCCVRLDERRDADAREDATCCGYFS